MSEEKAKSPRAEREAIFEDLRVLERLVNRLLVRAITQAGEGPVGERVAEILLVTDSMASHVARLEAVDAEEGEPAS